MDPLSVVEDEVALEGLDGITIPSLWIRLESRQPKFPLKLDDYTKEFVWRYLTSNAELKFYQLPKERDDVVLTDRFKDIDPETGIETIQKSLEQRKDVYPVHIIQENKDGILGSCAVFKERKDVTKHVRSGSLSPSITLQEAVERYGRRLVIVASQKLRFRTLIGRESDPDLTLTNESYCVLERVGRARWQGELQKEMHKLSFKTDARKLHYMRKSLVRHGLVSMQSYVTRNKTGHQQHSILLHLKRFYINRRSKYDILMEQMSHYFENMPGQISTIFAVKKHFNLNGSSYRRIFTYMKTAKMIEFRLCPLEELDPSVGPCFNKHGKKVQARCLKLLKPYSQKDVHDDVDDEDDEDDNDTGARKRALPAEGRFMETDILSQAYQMVLSSGTRGLTRMNISRLMNIGPLEARMLCRTLERTGSIKGFMVDEGRQRTTRYISHKCVGVSDQLQLFAKEQERCKMLSSSGPQMSNSALATPETPSASVSKEKGESKTPAKKTAQKTGSGRKEDGEEAKQMFGSEDMNVADGKKEKAGGAAKTKGRKSGVNSNQAQPEVPDMQPTTAEDQAEKEERESSSAPAGPLPQNEDSDSTENKIEVVDDAFKLQAPSSLTWSKRPLDRTHETYRKLRRKNLVVEAICNFKVIEGTYLLQKIISDTEKEDGCNTKCCKKTILRLIHSLSREGLVKMYKTTIIQDGITKNIQMYVHPSVQPNDDIVNRTIETVRFKMSSSYAASRVQEAEERAKQLEKDKRKEMESFKPTTVKGLGRSLGFQTKMHRLRIIHNFLWYLIYGHPLKYDSSDHTNETPEITEAQIPGKAASGSADPQTAESSTAKLDILLGDEDDEEQSASASGSSAPEMKVFSDEDSWKRYIPPVRMRKGYGVGWAMVGDLFLCLPLSVFIQVIQINYKVDGLEEYLNDPEKQHHLVRSLPAKMKRQLLYKRKFIFSFSESLQRLVYMGLLQFGPVAKFMDKDQVFVFLRRNATIVDTTSAEPHYWLVTEPPDKPFDRRRYTFKTFEDVENYWFDLMCVCLNTPLGVIRKRDDNEDESAPSFVSDRYVFVGLSYLLRGSREVRDDGVIPGDAKGAGGLHSEFFSHLKRNWMWTNHLLTVKKPSAGSEVKEATTRLNSLLSKHALRIALRAGGPATPQYVTNKKSKMPEKVEVGIEPASRNKQVVGGKNQKRKRSKKEVVKPPRKRKKVPKKRGPAHDEVDHKALKMMTRQRVLWTEQEDSLLLLCSVASHLFNNKSKRPFVPYCVIRDLLHAKYETSADKTSSAVGRRARYILKNPQTLLNYRISLAEVFEDKPLMKALEKSRPADPDNAEECATAFTEYIRLLRDRFSSDLINREVVIPDTKHELFSQFRVSAIESRTKLPSKDTLSCTDDIHACVLHNLIQSTLAMTNHQMKSSRSFLTFHMYTNYSQELLCQVFIECRKRGLANRRHVSQSTGPKKNRGLPILPMSYHLSQSFYRRFSWHFPHSLCTDSFRLVRSLMACKAEEDKPLTTFYTETESRSVQGEMMDKKTKTNKKTSDGGEALRQQSEAENANRDAVKEGEDNQRKAEEVDKHMDVGDERSEAPGKPTGQKNQEDSSTAGSADDPSAEERVQDHPPEAAPTDSSADDPSAEERVQDRPPEAAPTDSSAEAAEKFVDVSDMLQFSLDAPGGACVAALSLLSLGLLSVHLSIPKQMVVVDSTMVDNDAVKSMTALEDEDEDDNDGKGSVEKKTLQVKAHQASHTNYLMMRGYCSPGIVKFRNLNTTDNIVLESCNVRLQLRSKPAHNLFTEDISGPPELNLVKYGPSLVPPNLTYTIHSSLTPSPSDIRECEERLMEQRGYTSQDIEACAQIRHSLDEVCEYGVDDQDFRQTHLHLQEPQDGRTRSLQQYLKDLQEESQVLKVGGLGPRWVLIQHAKPWLLTLNPKQWSQSGAEADQLSLLQKQHTFPFLQKRSRRATRREKEGPPAKKSKVDEEDVKEKEDKEDTGVSSSDVAAEEVNEKQPDEKKQSPDEEGAGEGSNVQEEGGEKEHSEEKREEEVGHEKVEAEGKQERRRGQRSRRGSINEEKDEDGSRRAEAADVNNDEKTSFISRPWRMVDGILNRQVLKGMLEGVLFHVMYQPGLTHRSLVEHYKASLQPSAVMDLLEALISLGCVKKRTLVKAPKPSLFSSAVPKARSETPKMGDDPDCVFYEPTISCCLRLAQVLPNERHWNSAKPPQSQ